jgi:hypothetical protein
MDIASCLQHEIIAVLLLTEPGTAPRNVQVRPLSSSTMVIQWDEPETPNGQVTVRCTSDCHSAYILSFYLLCFLSFSLLDISSLLLVL